MVDSVSRSRSSVINSVSEGPAAPKLSRRDDMVENQKGQKMTAESNERLLFHSLD
jgi:hypothetical protein